MAEQELDITSLSARVEHLEAEANLRKKNISWLKNYLDELKQEFNSRPELGQLESLQGIVAQLTEQVASLQQRVLPLDETKTGETLATVEIAVTESANTDTDESEGKETLLSTQQARLRGFSDEEFKAERIMLLLDRIYALEEEKQKQPISTEEFLRRYNAGERDFTEINLAGANLSNPIDRRSYRRILQNLNLTKANLTGANFTYFDQSHLNLSKANLRGAILSVANLQGASLVQANLLEANLEGADLQGANLLHVIYNLETKFPQGFDPKTMEAYLIAPGIVLQKANLSGADLQSVDLRGATLNDVNLCQANLQGAKLCGANLNSADLRGANLQDADLSGADLTKAKLAGANFQGARLTGVILPNGTLYN